MSDNTRIRDVCSRFSSGKAISASKVYEEGKYPVYGGNGLRGYTDTFNFDGDCAVIGRQGAYCGNVKYFSGKGYMTEHAVVAVANQHNNSRFLAYKFALMDLGRYAGQSAQPGLSVETLLDVEIDVPEKDVQDDIARVLSTIDEKIENNNEICSNLEAMAKLLYDYWFVQFDFPDENGKPYKSSGGKMVWNDELKREIPAGWKAGTFGDCISSINTGLNPRDNFKLNTGGTIKYLTVKNLTKDGTIDFSSCDFIDETARSIVHRRSDIKVGDILFASIAPLGRCCIISDKPEDWDINESVFSIRPDYQKMTSVFLYMTFMSDLFIKKAEGSSVGSVFKGIRISELQDLKTVIPPKSILDSFGEQVEQIHKMTSNAVNENQQLASLRDFLLPMLMNGQVKVGA